MPLAALRLGLRVRLGLSHGHGVPGGPSALGVLEVTVFAIELEVAGASASLK
jgi:hypothetical protein